MRHNLSTVKFRITSYNVCYTKLLRMMGRDDDLLTPFDQFVKDDGKECRCLIAVGPKLDLVHPDKGAFVFKQMAELHHPPCKRRDIVADTLGIA